MLGVATGLAAGSAALLLLVLGTRVFLDALNIARSGRGLLLATGILILVAAELFGAAPRLAANRRVPARWVNPPSLQAGVVWGLALGAGLVTEAPYLMLHAALLLAAVLPSGAAAWQVPMAFALGRMAALSFGPLRRAIEAGMSRRVPAANDAGQPLTILVARTISRIMLLVIAASSFGGLLA